LFELTKQAKYKMKCVVLVRYVL